MIKVEIIFAMDDKKGIGRAGKIPWHNEIDSMIFRDMTRRLPRSGVKNLLVAGKNTIDSVMQLNDDRRKVIRIDEFLKLTDLEGYGRIIVIGGAKTYDFFFNDGQFDITTVYISHIPGEHECDVFMSDDYLKTTGAMFLHRDYIFGIRVQIYTRAQQPLNPVDETYAALCRKLLSCRQQRATRNGYVLSKFGWNMKFDLRKSFPLITTKAVNFRAVFEELMMFLRGQTNTKVLSDKGIKIWEPNTNKAFQESVGLGHYEDGEMGPNYGHNWRDFDGVDQLRYVINELIANPTSRRIMMTTFNPRTVNQCVLYPCHGIITQFYADGEYLNCSTYIRSSDVCCGLPFNIASYGLLLLILANALNMIPRKLIINIGDAHIYSQHITNLCVQMTRPSCGPAKVNIALSPGGSPDEVLKKIISVEWSDITCEYDNGGFIKYVMVA